MLLNFNIFIIVEIERLFLDIWLLTLCLKFYIVVSMKYLVKV